MAHNEHNDINHDANVPTLMSTIKTGMYCMHSCAHLKDSHASAVSGSSLPFSILHFIFTSGFSTESTAKPTQNKNKTKTNYHPIFDKCKKFRYDYA